jgi:hypothetical protein
MNDDYRFFEGIIIALAFTGVLAAIALAIWGLT